MVRVLIVENDPLAIQLFTIFLENHPRYRLVHILESALYAESYCAANHVDLILMDICTDLGSSGLEVAAKIKKNMPSIKIIIITGQPECDFINRARKGGVDSFWYKTVREVELLKVIDKILKDGSILLLPLSDNLDENLKKSYKELGSMTGYPVLSIPYRNAKDEYIELSLLSSGFDEKTLIQFADKIEKILDSHGGGE
jgi:DNA-binding NarL/FixJ family response regulator